MQSSNCLSFENEHDVPLDNDDECKQLKYFFFKLILSLKCLTDIGYY